MQYHARAYLMRLCKDVAATSSIDTRQCTPVTPVVKEPFQNGYQQQLQFTKLYRVARKLTCMPCPDASDTMNAWLFITFMSRHNEFTVLKHYQ